MSPSPTLGPMTASDSFSHRCSICGAAAHLSCSSRAHKDCKGEAAPIAKVYELSRYQWAAEEPLGHAAAIITDVLENAETNHVISAVQKQALVQEMALRLT
ncbi:hypothetical protein GBA52_017172 [Prunus armeniaca]|nr:hypothetical protein GBA52_017172 [Prunus armeniaca]